MLGDLEEEFGRRAAASPLRARMWYRGQALRSLGPALGLRMDDDGRGAMDEGRGWSRTVVAGLGFAGRSIRRAPGFTAVVVGTLALGIGANATMFGIVDRLLLQPPAHIVDADRVVEVHFDRLSPFTRQQETSPASSWPDLQDLEEVSAFAAVAGYGTSTRTVGSGASAERIPVQLVGGAMFELLGVRPHRGRFFGPDEDRPDGGERVAVLSHGFWMRRFGGAEDALGQTLRLGSESWTIVGVAPEGFTGPAIAPVDVFLPLATAQAASSPGLQWREARRWYWFRNVARLRDGVSVAAAEEEATAAHRAGRAEEIALGRYDEDARVALGSIVPGQALDAAGEVSVARWLAGVSIVVLLIACANVANLLLVRAVRWRRELAVRRALGISRGRLVGVLLVEVLVLAGLAGAAAAAVARWGSEVLYRALLPQLDPGQVLAGPRMLLFTAGVAGAAALLAGLGPALAGARGDVARDLKEGGGRGPRSARARGALLVAQVAMSTVLLVGAGLFLRSLRTVYETDLGFDAERVLVASLETDAGSFNEQTSAAVGEAVERLRGQPGIESVAAATMAPFRGLWGMSFRAAGTDSLVVPHGPYYYGATPGYFETMGMTIERGRPFTDGDLGAGAPPVAILTADLARRAFPDGDALGGCILLGEPDDEEDPPPCTTVVGIVGDHRSTSLEETESLLYYLPATHEDVVGTVGLQMLVVRTAGPPEDQIARVRDVLLSATPSARFASVTPMRDSIDSRARSWRLGATLFAVFGALALVVASLGLYAILAFDVAQRARELAVRSALGAPAGVLARHVVRRSLLLTVGGTLLGLAVAVALSGRVQELLYRVEAVDLRVMGVVAATLLAVALAAAVVPAGRAGRIPPATVLRSE